jgi:hypothetical protein
MGIVFGEAPNTAGEGARAPMICFAPVFRAGSRSPIRSGRHQAEELRRGVGGRQS